MRGLKYCKLRGVWAKAKKRKVLFLVLFIVIAAILASIIIWGLKTGRFRFLAAVGCPANTVCNQAAITYTDSQGVIRTVDSNFVMVQLNSPTVSPSVIPQLVKVMITLPTFNHDYSTANTDLKVFNNGSQTVLVEKNDLAMDSSGQD